MLSPAGQLGEAKMNNSKNWVHLGSALAVSVMGVLIGFDWSSVVSAPTAGKVVMVLGMAKAAMSVAFPDKAS
jgi:hypothetical protein